MRKITIIILVLSITLSSYSNNVNLTKKDIDRNYLEQPIKIKKINGKMYIYKKGEWLPLLGIVFKLIMPAIKKEIYNSGINFITDLFKKKEIDIVDEKLSKEDNVETIIIHGQDKDNDGKIEFYSECEDHNKDGENDNITDEEEFENYEHGLEVVIDEQLTFTHQFYTE